MIRTEAGVRGGNSTGSGERNNSSDRRGQTHSLRFLSLGFRGRRRESKLCCVREDRRNSRRRRESETTRRGRSRQPISVRAGSRCHRGSRCSSRRRRKLLLRNKEAVEIISTAGTWL